MLFIFDGKNVRLENGAPFAIGGDDPQGDYHPWNLPLGKHILTAIPFEKANAQGLPGKPLTIYFKVVANKVESFTLVNANTNRDIQPVNDGSVIYLNTLPTTKLNIRANTDPLNVGSVVFVYDGKTVRTENGFPYSLGGDNPAGDYHPWTLSLGAHTLTAIPYALPNGTGSQGKPLTIHFTVQNAVSVSLQQQRGVEQSITSINQKEIVIEKTEVFPNPANDRLSITSTTEFGSEKQMKVLDVNGRTTLVGLTKKSDRMIELNISGLQKGVYFIKIKQGEKYKTLSFIKL